MGLIQGELDFDHAIAGLLPKQKEFLQCRERYCDYTGGFGSGKSVILCVAAITHGQLIPGGLFLVGRLNYPALRDTTRRTFLELIPEEIVADWKPSENQLTCKNGSQYLFRHLDMSDAMISSHVRSLNLTGWYLDEASEIPHDVFLTLTGRLRRKNLALDKGPSHFGRTSGNPAGRDWRWATFHDPERDDVRKKKFYGITAPTTENIHLPQDYQDDLLYTLPKDWVERFVYGSFADFSDLVYKDFDYKQHVWDSKEVWPIFNGRSTPPDDWPVIVGIDIGGVDPWAIGFWAIQPVTGNLFLFDEIYEAGILIERIAERYNAVLLGRNFEAMAYDYENQQAAYELAEHGILGEPANKDVKAGLLKVAQYMHPDPRLVHPFTGKQGSPRMFFASHCLNHIREYSTYKWAKDRLGKPTGKPADGDDHTCDSSRYAIHTFRPSPDKPRIQQVWENPELDELSRLFWYDLHKQEQKKTTGRMRFGGRMSARWI